MNRRRFLATAAAATFAQFSRGAGNGRIRIAMIGTAHSHAPGKMESILSLPELFEVVGIAEPAAAPRNAAQSARPFAGLRFSTEAELLADPTVRVVAIETTLADSPRAASAAIRAGKHIHLDKPGAANH